MSKQIILTEEEWIMLRAVLTRLAWTNSGALEMLRKLDESISERMTDDTTTPA